MPGFVRAFTVIGLITVLGFSLYWLREYKKKASRLDSVIEGLTDCNRELKNTLLVGIVNRFSSAPRSEPGPSLAYPRFVAKIMRVNYGGKTSVTKANSEYGVDIEHQRGNDLHLGRVCCPQANELTDYEPVAIIHSQMIKRGAAGAFVATTSDFTSKALKYAEDLDVDLINGGMLVELWTHSLARTKAKGNSPLGIEA